MQVNQLNQNQVLIHYADAAVNTDLTCGDVEALERELSKVKVSYNCQNKYVQI